MKNTTKKILSMILAVIMLLSVMPFGFSAEAKLSSEGQELVSAYVKMMSYQHNRYKQGDNILNSQIREITNIQSKACNEVINRYGWNVETYDYLNDSANAQAIEESTQIYKAAIKDIEHFLEEQEITIVIDTYEYTMIAQYERLYSDEEIVTAEKAVEKNAELFEEASYFYSEASKLLDEFNTQEEFDVYWKQGMPIWEMFYNCLDDNHDLIKADGTNTFVCDFCGVEKSVREAFIETFTKSLTYNLNAYADDEHGPQVIGDGEFFDLLVANDEEKMLEYTERMKEVNSSVEEKIANGKLVILIDIYDFAEAFVKILVAYSDPARAEIFDEIPDRNPEWSEEKDNAFSILSDLVNNGGTQAEYDIYEEIVVDAIELCVKHMYGEHNYIRSADTNTFVCEFCGAEKSVKDAFIEEYARWGAYYEYCSYAEGSEVAERYTKLNLDENTKRDILRAGKENDTEKMLSYIEIFKEKNREIEKAINGGKLTVVIDGYYVALLECKVFFYSDYLEYDINGKPLYIYERNAELFEEADAAHQKANNIRFSGGTQEEYDVAIKKWVYAYSLGLKHVFGEHDFTKADGTKTSVCEFCGAKEIVFEGQYGDNLYFEVDSSGKLTLSGSGEAWTPEKYIEYIENNFNDEQKQAANAIIKKIDEMIITEAVSDIGAWALLGFHSYPNEDSHPILEKITVDKNNPYLVVENNILFNKDKTELIMYPKMADATSYVIPEGIKKISDWAFYACSNLKDITVSTSVDYIGRGAFQACLDIESINYCGTQEDWKRVNNDLNGYESIINFEAHKDADRNDICDYCKISLKEEINDSTDTGNDNNTDNGNDNNTVSCSCNCHKGGFIGIIWKILTFFYKIFGTNKTCACGVAHY